MKKLWIKIATVTILFWTLVFVGLAIAAGLPDEYIEVKGIAEPDQTYTNGVRAAELIAFRKIAEAIGEFPLDSESTVKDGKGSEIIRTRLNATLRRVRVLDEGKQPDGYYYAIVRMPMYGANSVASVVFDRDKVVEPMPQPKFPQPVASGSSSGGGYTGVIIDCRGKGLEKAMSPVIKSDAGQVIYGAKNLDYDAIISRGMASYTSSVTVNVERAGSNPLIVKAVKVEGYGTPCNPVVSAADADKILSANMTAHFLEKCNVVFVN